MTHVIHPECPEIKHGDLVEFRLHPITDRFADYARESRFALGIVTDFVPFYNDGGFMIHWILDAKFIALYYSVFDPVGKYSFIHQRLKVLSAGK